jgi:hypothetical protein
MDEEIDLLRKTDPPRLVPGVDVAVWEMKARLGAPDLKRNLRIIHCERRYEAPDAELLMNARIGLPEGMSRSTIRGWPSRIIPRHRANTSEPISRVSPLDASR